MLQGWGCWGADRAYGRCAFYLRLFSWPQNIKMAYLRVVRNHVWWGDKGELS